MNLTQTTGYFIECGAALTPERNNTKFPFTRNHFMEPHQIGEFIQRYNNIDVYQTSIIYINPYWKLNKRGKWIIDAGESLKWSNLYLDFDSELENEKHHENMKEDIEMAIRYITLIFKIPESYIQIYFSGRKGYHVIVDANTVGLEPHVKLNQIFKEIAEEIKSYTKHDTLDLGIYDDKRLFRIVNSINDKGQRYKIPLTVDELRKITLEEVRELAKTPRYLEFPNNKVSSKAPEVFKGIVEKWTNQVERQKDFSQRVLNIKELPPCIKEMHQKIFRETIDERNNSGTALASFYFQRNYAYADTMDILMEWGSENCKPALKTEDIKTIVESVYNGGYRYGCGTFSRVSGVCEKKICPLFANQKEKDEVSQEDIEKVNPYDYKG